MLAAALASSLPTSGSMRKIGSERKIPAKIAPTVAKTAVPAPQSAVEGGSPNSLSPSDMRHHLAERGDVAGPRAVDQERAHAGRLGGGGVLIRRVADHQRLLRPAL